MKQALSPQLSPDAGRVVLGDVTATVTPSATESATARVASATTMLHPECCHMLTFGRVST